MKSNKKSSYFKTFRAVDDRQGFDIQNSNIKNLDILERNQNSPLIGPKRLSRVENMKIKNFTASLNDGLNANALIDFQISSNSSKEEKIKITKSKKFSNTEGFKSKKTKQKRRNGSKIKNNDSFMKKSGPHFFYRNEIKSSKIRKELSKEKKVNSSFNKRFKSVNRNFTQKSFYKVRSMNNSVIHKSQKKKKRKKPPVRGRIKKSLKSKKKFEKELTKSKLIPVKKPKAKSRKKEQRIDHENDMNHLNS